LFGWEDEDDNMSRSLSDPRAELSASATTEHSTISTSTSTEENTTAKPTGCKTSPFELPKRGHVNWKKYLKEAYDWIDETIEAFEERRETIDRAWKDAWEE
jgi:hypothetical protein